jgi:hypothetical protein
MSLEQALTTMLLERAQRNLIKYQTMARQFQAKYGQDFETFRQSVLDTHPSQDVEQDYFEWELAITGITDMEEEIQRLRDSG